MARMKISSHSPSDFTRSKAAFTLVEVLVAVAILGILTAATFATYSFGFAVVEKSREDLRATQILTEKIESLRLFTWDELILCPTSIRESYDPTGMSSGGPGIPYVVNLNIAAPTNIPAGLSYSDDMRLITVAVTWTNQFAGKPLAHTRWMQTVFAKNGMQNYLWGQYK